MSANTNKPIIRIIFTTKGLKTSGIHKQPTRRPPTATPASYLHYNQFVKHLLFDSRFVQHNGEKQQEILDWIEQEFFNWLNDIRSRHIRTEHPKKRAMFWTIAGRILDKYDLELSSDSDASDASGASGAFDDAEQDDGLEDQAFASTALLPPINCAQYLETTMSEISALAEAHSHVLGGAACAPASMVVFPWEVVEPSTDPKDLSE